MQWPTSRSRGLSRRVFLAGMAAAAVALFIRARTRSSGRDESVGAAREAYRVAERALWASYGARPTDRFVDVDAPRVRVRVQEVGSGPPALFVHSGMTSGSVFAPVVARYRARRCLLLDRPGCGLSENWAIPGAEFRQEAISVIGSVLDTLGIERAALIGHSVGCLWSTWFALEHPHRVQSLTLIGSSIGFPGVQPPLFLRILSRPVIGDFILSRQIAAGTDALQRSLVAWGHGPSLEAGVIPEPLLAWMVADLTLTMTPLNDIRQLRRQLSLFGPREWIQLSTAELASIRVPTLFLSGDSDPASDVSSLEARASLVPNATLKVLPGGGHTPWFDDPVFVTEAIARHVS
jgi:2-hydroxy-6-oxonona-2,4-dienedioate hydrolase